MAGPPPPLVAASDVVLPATPFPHPYQPYDIQVAFMQAVYTACVRRQVAIMESPTGTGKTLSLICSALHWQREARDAGGGDSDGEGTTTRSSCSSASSAAASSAVPPRVAPPGKASIWAAPAAAAAAAATAAALEPAWLVQSDAARAAAAAAARRARAIEVRRVADASLARVRADEEHERAGGGRAPAAPGGGSRRSGGGDGDGGKRHASGRPPPSLLDDSALLLDDWTSDDDTRGSSSGGGGSGGSGSSSATAALADALRRDLGAPAAGALVQHDAAAASGDGDDGAAAVYTKPQVFFVSRTHSQLAQFVREIGKTTFAAGTRVVVLGSRRQLCVNDDVVALASDTRINERCLELADAARRNRGSSAPDAAAKRPRPATPPLASATHPAAAAAAPPSGSGGGCPMLADGGAQRLFRDRLLASSRDIEAAHELGAWMGTCAYYGSRKAVPLADVVAMPYTVLLQRGTRDSLGLRLDGAVVIIDEAHNLLDAINAMHSAVVTGAQLASATAQVRAYLTRYAARLSSANFVHCSQLAEVLERLLAVLHTTSAAAAAPALSVPAPTAPAASVPAPTAPAAPAATIMALSEFSHAARLDAVNLFKVVRYVEAVALVRKLRGFAEAGLAGLEVGVADSGSGVGGGGGGASADGGADAPSPPSYMTAVTAMQSVVAFLTHLTAADTHGRVLIVRGASPRASGATGGGGVRGAHLKYLNLNAGAPFAEVLARARAVILAGGTMQPVSSMVAQLFATLPPGRLRTFSCGHIVPRDNLVAFAVGAGPAGVQLDFRFPRRAADALVDELGRAVVSLATLVPAGLVVFLPSFDYEATVWSRWSTAGAGTAAGTVLEQLARRKRVFREPRAASDLDAVLRDYAAAAAAGGGAVLFSVVGGKMSEGINFSDDLARGVAVVGLPYPNAADVELAERMAYMDATAAAAGGGREYYEGLCMKAVNQSIGRSIRHVADYAAIYLLDARFSHDRIRRKLPAWIGDRVVDAPAWGTVVAGTAAFFRPKRHATAAGGGGGGGAAAPVP